MISQHFGTKYARYGIVHTISTLGNDSIKPVVEIIVPITASAAFSIVVVALMVTMILILLVVHRTHDMR